ncbi:hypothetical protein ZIOFF_071420 [Zingiber officinale]|uniref:Uncharacterized protein n=1 Tax=Zingiber officinale TaxID=94328 RepID=A0A8J5C9H6_ZINOF|nr:hypothetical protein ZIOFF_071420 [Zingiber officinale]
MAEVFLKELEGAALVSRKKDYRGGGVENNKDSNFDTEKYYSLNQSGRKSIKCYRCGKIGHIKENCWVKLKEGNVAGTELIEDEEDWGKCFMAENKTMDAMNSINFDKDWIVDSGCGHHLIGDDRKFSNIQQYSGRQAIVIADNTVHQVKNQGTVIINGKHQDSIMLEMCTMFQACFLWNIKELKADVVHTSKRVNDLFVLSTSNLYVEKMSSNDNLAISHARLGHVNMEKLKAMVKMKLVDGLPQLNNFSEGHICEGFEAELCTKIKQLRIDSRGEFTSNEFSSFCCENDIKRELSCAETPQQNGAAERKIRHLTETCKSWLHAKNLSKAFWVEGMMCAANVINRLPQSPTNKKSPYELMFGKKPNVKHMRVFDSICYVHVPESKRSKLDAKARKCIFVGYDEREKGWKFLDPTSHRFVVSRDVVFDEVSWYYGVAPVNGDSKSFEHKSINLSCSINNIFSSSSSSQEGQQGKEVLNRSQSHHQQEELKEEQSERGSSNQSQAQQEEEIIDVENSQRPWRNITKPARYRDENFISTYSCFFAGPVDDDEPSCYEEAKEIEEWKCAMDEEIDALKKIKLGYDIVITGNNEREIEKLQDELSVRFDMKSLGELRHLLGLEVENREDGIFVSQKGYAMKLVERFG